MYRIVFLAALTIACFAQTAPIRIPSEEAAKHLLKKQPPVYPAFAEQAHIQGNVILQIGIDESGAAYVHRLVSGHPMLAPAAIEAVKRWKYQPFEMGGKPVPVLTVVMVNFGGSGEPRPEDRAEMAFQDEFWKAQDAAQAAFARADYAGAERELEKAQALIASDDGSRHSPERWQWAMTTGHVNMARQKFADAEQSYTQALKLCQNDDPDTPEVAGALSSLGSLFAQEKQFDRAHENLTKSISIYRKNFTRVGAGNAGAQQVYGRAIAYQSWMLVKLASQHGDQADEVQHCHAVLEFQRFLADMDRAAFVSACGGESYRHTVDIRPSRAGGTRRYNVSCVF